MQSMISFATWFLSEIPSFLMSEPIVYIWGLVFFAYIFRCFLSFRRY